MYLRIYSRIQKENYNFLLDYRFKVLCYNWSRTNLMYASFLSRPEKYFTCFHVRCTFSVLFIDNQLLVYIKWKVTKKYFVGIYNYTCFFFPPLVRDFNPQHTGWLFFCASGYTPYTHTENKVILILFTWFFFQLEYELVMAVSNLGHCVTEYFNIDVLFEVYLGWKPDDLLNLLSV